MVTDCPVTGCSSVSYCSGQTWRVCLHVLRLNTGNKLWNSDLLLWINKSTCGTLVIISSLVIFTGCSHVVGQLPDYITPTFSLVPSLFLSLSLETGESNGNQSRERHHRGTKGRARELNERRGAPLKYQPDGCTRHPSSRRGERWRGEHKQAHTSENPGRGVIRETKIKVTEKMCVRIENKIKD